MDPIAFEIFGISVRWYGIVISIGMVLGILLATKESEKQGLGEDTIVDLALWLLPLAVIGARVHYVIFEWDRYQGDIMKMINIREGGLAIHGGIFAGVLVGLIYCKIKNVKFFKIADIVAPSLILGQAIGRWGNYINQEAHGGPTDLPWGIMVDGVKVHPTFLYESLGNLLIFGFLLWFRRNAKKEDGEVFFAYFGLYSLIRFFIEGLRTDSLMWGDIRVAQLISIAGIIVAILGIVINRKRASKI